MDTVKERILISGCEGEKNGYNTQLLYFTCSSLSMDDRIYPCLPGREASVRPDDGRQVPGL